MRRLFAVLFLVQAGAASAAPLALPPTTISKDEVLRMETSRSIEAVYQLETDGLQHIVGFIYGGVSGVRATGAYAFAPSHDAYVEFYATRGGLRVGEFTIPVAAENIPYFRHLLRGVIPTFYTRFSMIHAENLARVQAMRGASPGQPAPPQPTHVKPTFLDRTLLATSSPIAAVWNEHRFLSILAFVLLGCVLGARARTGGPRPIEIRQDDVLAALAVSERKLSASRARLQQLSSAIDAEESQFIQRVSAIVERR